MCGRVAPVVCAADTARARVAPQPSSNSWHSHAARTAARTRRVAALSFAFNNRRAPSARAQGVNEFNDPVSGNDLLPRPRA